MPIAQPSELPRWASLDAWAATTFYAVGERVTNDGGRIYVCVAEGTSAGAGGPTGVGAGIVDGTVTWDFSAANAPAWVTLTVYALGNRVTNDGGKIYQCIVAGTSGAAPGPTGTAGTSPPNPAITDGTVSWIYAADSEAQITAPSTGQKDLGWIPGQRPPAQYLNWFMWTVYRWILYFTQPISDWLSYGARTDVTNTFIARQVIEPATPDDDQPVLDLDAGNVTDVATMIRMGVGGLGTPTNAQIYRLASGVVLHTVNASWNDAANKWTQDDGAKESYAWRLGPANGIQVQRKASGSADWVDGSWDLLINLNTAPTFWGEVTTHGVSVGIFSALDYGSGTSVTVREIYGTGGKIVGFEVWGSVTTTDAVTTAVPIVYAIPTSQAVHIVTEYIGTISDFSAIATYMNAESYRRAGAAPVGGAADALHPFNDGIGCAATPGWAINGNNIEIQILGKAATTIRWMIKSTITVIG